MTALLDFERKLGHILSTVNRLPELESLLRQILENQKHEQDWRRTMQSAMEKLTAAEGDVKAEILNEENFLAGLAADIRSRLGDEQALSALADDMETQAAALRTARAAFPAVGSGTPAPAPTGGTIGNTSQPTTPQVSVDGVLIGSPIAVTPPPAQFAPAVPPTGAEVLSPVPNDPPTDADGNGAGTAGTGGDFSQP